MSKVKPAIPKGTRDFSPITVTKRNYIINIIREIYQRYGFLPIETPAMENLSTLTGKYGDEGDKLLFRILRSGNFLEKVEEEELKPENYKEITSAIAEKGLRYDLTVPFARYVVMYQHEISFPFRRYQIQPVWRADRPQKGRYQEFWQCDADIIGTDSLLCEVDLVCIIRDVFYRLDLHPTIFINNRKVLQGITEVLGFQDQYQTFLTILDKTDKIGIDAVVEQLKEKVDATKHATLDDFFTTVGQFGNDHEVAQTNIGMLGFKFTQLQELLKDSKAGSAGLEEVATIYNFLKEIDPEFSIYTNFDPTLARGLTYYTGTIFEVRLDLPDIKIGSVCGGGRYDDLTGIFGMEGTSGVGISFGLDRIYDVMEEMNIFPVEITDNTKVMFANFGDQGEAYALKALQKVRQAGINAELYPSSDRKLDKQMKYANGKGIPFVVLAGDQEMANNTFTLKDMVAGEQSEVSLGDLLKKLRN